MRMFNMSVYRDMILKSYSYGVGMRMRETSAMHQNEAS